VSSVRCLSVQFNECVRTEITAGLFSSNIAMLIEDSVVTGNNATYLVQASLGSVNWCKKLGNTIEILIGL
jgi:hypothetical protein